MHPISAFLLYTVTAFAEIFGCYAIYLFFRLGKPAWWLIPAALSLALFAWLLSLHPGSAGRVYAVYGAVYITASMVWLWLMENQRPDQWDILGTAVCLIGAAIIYFGPRA